MNVNYLTEPVAGYVAAIGAATSPESLVLAIEPYGNIAADALAVALKVTEADWPEFKRGLKLERRRSYAGDAWNDRYGAILMPAVMMEVSLVAHQFAVPWGLACLRLVEVKKIRLNKNGTYVLSLARSEPQEE